MSEEFIVFDNHYLRVMVRELGPYETNCYVVVRHETGESILIDFPDEPDTIISMLHDTSPLCMILTHNHMDHTGALPDIKSRLDIPLIAHAADTPLPGVEPDIIVSQDDIFRYGKHEFSILHTPGHTPGSICVNFSDVLISGDTLFPGGPGRTETPEDFRAIITSIKEKLLILPDNTILLPGHGPGTTIGNCRKEYEAFCKREHDPDLCGDVLWDTD